jgi:hypothetical protein
MIYQPGLAIQQFGELCATAEVTQTAPIVTDERMVGLFFVSWQSSEMPTL